MAGNLPLIVGAIDFGTTFSGWACSFRHQYVKDPTSATTRIWYSGQVASEKTPTYALITADHKLEAFGYDAEDTYKELLEKNEHTNYFLFRRFKMALCAGLQTNLASDLTIKDDVGKPLSALTVFALSIEFLADDLVKNTSRQVANGITKEEVTWVLTVPAIWTDAAKQFMRKAAEQAGLKPEKLTIALEPESASIFCRHLSVDKKAGSEESTTSLAAYQPGTRYMILDVGGGTVDITVHEITDSVGVKEIMAATGGGWGGLLVDKAFEGVLIDILSPDLYEKFVQTETDDWIDLGRAFEVKKKTVDPKKDNRVTIKIPLSMIELFQKEKKRDLKDMIAESEFSNEIELSRDKIIFKANFIRGFFDEPIKKTITHVRSLLKDPRACGVEAILMVGGFSDSSMLQDAVKRAFPHLSIIIPKEASSAILRGAVIFGHQPEVISQRILKFTYGTDTCTHFDESIHPGSKKTIMDDEVYCKDVFDKHVEKGQSVCVGKAQPERRYFPIYDDQDMIDISLYASELTDPHFTDENCVYIGQLNVDISGLPEESDKSILLSLAFSDTEIKAFVRIEETDEIITETFDFLCDKNLFKTSIRR